MTNTNETSAGIIAEKKYENPKPCKEDGHAPIVRQDDIGWYVRCEVDFCDNCTGYFDTPEEALRVWNQRQEGVAK